MTKEEVIQQFVKNICPYCKGNCEKGIIIVVNHGARCVDYEKGELQGYSKPIERTAKQRKSIMGFTQNY